MILRDKITTRRSLNTSATFPKRCLSRSLVLVLAFSLFTLTVLYIKSLIELLGQGDGTTKDDATSNLNVPHDPNRSDSFIDFPKDVTLITSVGNIVIQLRPDLSPESVQYIKALLDSPIPCKRCRFYRAEQRGILQGVLKKPDVMPNEILGKCPDDVQDVPNCHGPLMTKGMVGWAAGEGGPDFFINNYPRVAEWWDHDHTVWGEVVDEDSLNVVDSFFDLPRHKDGLTYLDEDVQIELK